MRYIVKFLVLVICIGSVIGCGPDIKGLFNPVTSIADQASARLDQAIDELQNGSADMEDLLRDLEKDLVEIGVKNTIRVEVSDLIQRSTANAGIEVKCTVDFMRNRVAGELERIKDEILGREPVDRRPELCIVVQSAIKLDDIERGGAPLLEMSGYNFDLDKNIQAFLQFPGSETEVSQYLIVQTNYFMVFNLVGIYNDRLLDRVEHEQATLQFRWNDDVISTTLIQQPVTPQCETKEETINLDPVKYIPPRTRGDSDFSGNGPNVYVSVGIGLTNSDRSLYYEIYMKAEETKSDWTTSEGLFASPPFYNVPDKYVFESFLVPATLSSEGLYRDDDHEMDTFFPSNQGPIHHFEAYGDTSGGEAGSKTFVTVFFNQIKFRLKQVEGCRTPPAQLNIREMRINPEILKNLENIGQ